MIVSASRRTDIPAFYGEWFLNRLRAGFCLVPNPFNNRQISRVSLRREDVDAFVLWTRDARPFTPALDALDAAGYPYVVLFTLTGYGPPLEPWAPGVDDAVAAFHEVANRVGPERVVWRYDPVVLGPGLETVDHRVRFEGLARALEGATTRVITSMVDLYRKTRRRLAEISPAHVVDPALDPTMMELVAAMAACARSRGMELSTCAEERDLSAVGAPPGACVDGEVLRRLFGIRVHGKDRGQRRHCRCAPSRDIGIPDTCLHGCAYCYATRSHQLALRHHALHDPQAPSLLPVS